MKFLSNQTDKQNSFSFSLFALKELKLSIRMVIYSEEFHSNQYEFMNITKISNQRPNRAILGENKIFVFIIQEED